MLTRNDIRRVHGVVIFDEAKTVHEFHLGDVAGAMGLEVFEDIFLGD